MILALLLLSTAQDKSAAELDAAVKASGKWNSYWFKIDYLSSNLSWVGTYDKADGTMISLSGGQDATVTVGGKTAFRGNDGTWQAAPATAALRPLHLALPDIRKKLSGIKKTLEPGHTVYEAAISYDSAADPFRGLFGGRTDPGSASKVEGTIKIKVSAAGNIDRLEAIITETSKAGGKTLSSTHRRTISIADFDTARLDVPFPARKFLGIK